MRTRLLRLLTSVLEAAAYLPMLPLLSASGSTGAEESSREVRATVGTVLMVDAKFRAMSIDVPIEKGSVKLVGSVATNATLCSPVCTA